MECVCVCVCVRAWRSLQALHHWILAYYKFPITSILTITGIARHAPNKEMRWSLVHICTSLLLIHLVKLPEYSLLVWHPWHDDEYYCDFYGWCTVKFPWPCHIMQILLEHLSKILGKMPNGQLLFLTPRTQSVDFLYTYINDSPHY